MTKEQILAEIRRLAEQNGGLAPGDKRFAAETGVGRHSWRGRYWRRWSEAVEEAGFAPNERNKRSDRSIVTLRLVELTRKLKRFPTVADSQIERKRDSRYPANNAVNKLGDHLERIELVRAYALQHPEYQDVLDYLPPPEDRSTSVAPETENNLVEGTVYMLKLGKHYKIGKSFRVPQRHREIAIELPEKPDVVHMITTDDPTGIEAYWHKRFAAKHTNGEWFALTRDDIVAFKRRKFM